MSTEAIMQGEFFNGLRRQGRWPLERLMLALSFFFVAWIIIGF